MNWIIGGLCVIGILAMYFFAFAMCRMAAVGDAMMERHLQHLREMEAEVDAANNQ